jgi:hypothetical protein
MKLPKDYTRCNGTFDDSEVCKFSVSCARYLDILDDCSRVAVLMNKEDDQCTYYIYCKW